MTDRIEYLKIHNFRGVTQHLDLAFDNTKQVIMIFGENGTGKSTIADAIECVGNGSTAFLDAWKLGKGKRKESYIPTLGKSLRDVKIDLEFGNQTYNATLSSKGPKLCDTPDRPSAKVLRRKSLQAFIEADPSQRYKEVASFFDIPQIEASEVSLRQAFKEAKDKSEFATSGKELALESLQRLWEAEGSPDSGGPEAWARSQANIPTDTLKHELETFQSEDKLIENLTSSVQSYEQAKKEETEVGEKRKEAEESLARIESVEARDNAQLVNLLRETKDYLNRTQDTICPVCEQTEINPEGLIKKIDQRLGEMNRLEKAYDAKKKAEQNFQNKKALLQQARESMFSAAEKAQIHFIEAIPQLESAQNFKKDDPQALALHSELVVLQPDIQRKLSDTQKKYHSIASVRQQVETLDRKSQEAEFAFNLQKKLGQVVEIFEAKRKTYIETVLLEIEHEVDELYQKIHPRENIGQLKLKLDESQRGSLLYEVAFGKRMDVHPQPYYSDSHLDTLGLCIFLALAKRGNTSRTVVVLDDVLGSVDQQHLSRTLDVLLDYASNFSQVIITTHYRPLRDLFRYSRKQLNFVQLLELKPWNFEHGITTGETLGYAEELRQKLNEGSFPRDEIASHAGKLFESLLEFISRTYRCKVPHAIEPRFTFGELAQAPNRALKRELKIVRHDNGDSTESKLLPVYQELDQSINVRNLVGCHFNEWAGELSDNDVREMAEQALKFADTLICQDCGKLPTSDKSGSYWECSCGKTRMFPLQQPR